MIQAGEMNLVQAIVELEHRLGTLEKCYDYVIANNYSLTKPNNQQLEAFRGEVLKELQNKYPSLGLKKN